MDYQLWREDPANKRGDWTIFAVGSNYDQQLRVIDPKLSLEKTFTADSYEETMQMVHEYLGLPRYVQPDFQ